MKPADSSSPPLTGAERAALAVAVAVVVGMHVVNLCSAGPFWRDEIGDEVYAAMRSWGDIWANLKYDNFPPGLLVVLRAWHGLGIVGLGAETGDRIGGMLVGLAVVGAFWVNARLLGARAPFVSLAVFAASGLVVRVGDSVRPYGLGWLCLLLTFGLLWRVARAERPGWRAITTAAVAALLSVQFLYQNAFLLLAAGTAGMIVAAWARRWRAVAAVAGIGVLAAVSLLPYVLGPVREAGEWSVVSRVGMSWGHLFRLTWAGLASSSEALRWMWLAAVGLAVTAWVAARTENPADPARREALLYAGLTVGIGTPLFLGFLKVLGMAGSTWYVLPPLVLAASALDVAGDRWRDLPRWRWVPAAFLLLTLGLGLPGEWREVRMRVTNADLVAARANTLVGPDDLVVVCPWWCGVSFQYYYRGAATWATLPPLEENAIHRFDLIKRRIASPEGNAALLAQIGETLRAGHRVWVAGWFIRSPFPGRPMPVLKPAPDPIVGWNEVAYSTAWNVQALEFLQAHTRRVAPIPVPVPGAQTINETERMQFFVAEGWQP